MDSLKQMEVTAMLPAVYVQTLAVVNETPQKSFRTFLPHLFRNPSALRVFQKQPFRVAVVQPVVLEIRGLQ